MDQTGHRITKDFSRLHQAARRVGTHITVFLEALMADIQALEAKIDELRQAVADDEAADAALVQQLNATISDLQAQVAANQPIDTQPLIDSLESIKASLQPLP